MEKRFPGSERHIDRLRRQGLALEAPLFFSAVTLLVSGGVMFFGFRRIAASVVAVTVRCWGAAQGEVIECLNAVPTAGWLELGELLGVVSLVSLLFSWWMKRPRLQLNRVGIDGSRLSPMQWVSRLRRAPLFVLGYSTAFAVGAAVIVWVCRGDVVTGFLPGTADEVSSLFVRAAVGAGALVVGVGAVSGGTGIWQFWQKTRMTEQEVRQEHKDDSGDPLIKGQQRHLHQAMLHDELVKAVKRSAVVFVAPSQRTTARG